MSASEIEQLVAAINDNPDTLHSDLTPAVHALVRHGIAALPHVLPLLESDHDLTRLRAQRVLEGVTLAWVRERTPSPALTRADTHAWQELWRANGSYDWRGALGQRAEAVRLWRAWLQGQTG